MKPYINMLSFLGIGLAPFLILISLLDADAHEIRPAYLGLREIAQGNFRVLWKQPARQGRYLQIQPILPNNCRSTTVPSTQTTSESHIQHWTVHCMPASLNGKEISIMGLRQTLIDVLVHIQFNRGDSLSVILAPNQPSFVIFQKQPGVSWDYLILGIEHLLSGFDHILFVMGLMFLVKQPITLIKTITSFTIAHSLTLGLSVLNLVHLPSSPIEAVIALSILFLAFELTRPPQKRGLMARYPWVIAFGFGLLHGFGFAGTLSEIGLPQEALLISLFLFNVGVEMGQLLIVAAIVILIYLIERLHLKVPLLLTRTPIYGMGAISAYWTIQQIF